MAVESSATPERRVLLGISGGIAAYKSTDLVRRLRERSWQVRCALTRSARSFVAPLTLEVLSGNAVYEEEYLSPGVGGEERHIAAAKWADVLCVAPATAHLLARLALGLADDFLTTLALAFRGPLILAPAMHTEMWEKATVRRHVEELERRGAHLVGPISGPLASGEVGIGRMAEPAEIAAAVEAALQRRDLEGRTALVTAGPTFEPLDPVRYLGNRSSGKMGFAIASELARRGARTFLVAGPVALPTPAGVERHDVETTAEMERALTELAPVADLIVMAAAVSDFRPAAPTASKIKRAAGVPHLKLVANPDLLRGLATLAPHALRVGFAAETADLEREARAKLEAKGAHLLVANDVSRSDIGFGSEDNEVTVFRHDLPPIHLPRQPKTVIAIALVDLLAAELAARERQPAGTLG